MGWWGYRLFEGDSPLDALGELGDIIGIPDDTDNDDALHLYPVRYDDADALIIRTALETFEDEVLGALDNPCIAEMLPVVAAVYMSAGAKLPDEIKSLSRTTALGEIETAASEGWSDGGIGRIETLNDFIEKLDTYVPGTRVEFVSAGLFEKFAEHEGTGLINDKIG